MKRIFILLAIAVESYAAFSIPITDLSNGETGRIEFQSITPPDRYQYARLNMENTATITISAYLAMPNNYQFSAKVPAVVLSHGSGGVEPNIREFWKKELNAAGYAVFIPDSYTTRGVSETNSNVDAIPYPVHVADTLNALKVLATHPNIDSKRIYNMGFSKGGNAVFDTAWPTWQRPIDTKGIKFAGHIVWYPGNCNIRYRTDDREVPTAPIFVLLADHRLEEAQDVLVCRRYYDELIKKGILITYKEYKDARHGFDGTNFTYRVNRRTSSAKRCDMEVFMTTKRGSGVGNNGYDFKRDSTILTDANFVSSLRLCLDNGNVSGSRGGFNAREVQAESVKDAMKFLISLP